MTNANNAIFDDSIFTGMAAAIAADNVRKDDNATAVAAIQAQKMTAYAGAICALKDTPLRSGNLPKNVAAEFDAKLIDAGLLEQNSDGSIKRGGAGKRFRETVPGVLKQMRNENKIPTQATPDAILAVFEELELTSENELIAYMNKGREKYSTQFEAVTNNVAKYTWGKDKRGNPRPTGLKMGGAVKDYVENHGLDDAEAAVIAEIRQRFQMLRMHAEVTADEANKNKDAGKVMEEILAAL